jgi:hypothetical protein
MVSAQFCNLRRGWEGGEGGGRGGHPLLIDHISSGMSPTPRNRITWRKFLTKLTNFEKSRYRSPYFFFESEKFVP